jgi:hypothetical protein
MPTYGSIRDDGLDEPPTEVIGDSAHCPQGGGGFFRGGAIAPEFRHIDVIPEIEREAVEFLVGRDASRLDRPFFLDVPLSAPYTPWLPTDAHLGRSGAGHYGDFTAQVDARIGLDFPTDGGRRVRSVSSNPGVH